MEEFLADYNGDGEKILGGNLNVAYAKYLKDTCKNENVTNVPGFNQPGEPILNKKQFLEKIDEPKY